MRKIVIEELTFCYDERYINIEDATDMITFMLHKAGGAHHKTIQTMLYTCGKIRSNPAWRGENGLLLDI